MLGRMLALLAVVILADAPPREVVRPPVVRAASTQELVEVLVLLSAPPDDVLATLDANDVQPYRRLPSLRAFAAKVSRRGLDALARHPAVLGVQLDRRLHALTAESAVVIGADFVRDSQHLTGKGVVVAALDTGVDSQHPDLDGGIVAQKCFVLGGCPPNNTDVGDLAPEGSGHGTHIAGILTGDGVNAPKGLAPATQVVMVRVFDATSYGRESDWALAMDWVADNAARLKIRILNLSLGTDERYAGTCDADWPVMAASAQRLRQAGVVMFAASGNENEANAMVAPACLTGVISVGATYDAPLGREPDTGTYTSGCFDAATDAGTVMCLSNTSTKLDLLAPGSRIRAAAPGGGVAERRGTSQATPHASAAAALMLEVDPLLDADELRRILRETGTPVADPRAPGHTTPLINARAAVQATHDSWCSRRADLAECPLTLACDGGACTGRCNQGTCAIGGPALTGTFPAAAAGCSATGAGVMAALAALLGALRSRRRG